MSLIKTISLKDHGDDRGSLVALESSETVPFEIKRIYYIIGTQPGVSRGFHAHKNLKQLAVCIMGSCRFVLDDGTNREEVTLDNATTGLLINDLTWREMYDFTDDCVLMVLADHHYDESDYIRNYQEFINAVEQSGVGLK